MMFTVYRSTAFLDFLFSRTACEETDGKSILYLVSLVWMLLAEYLSAIVWIEHLAKEVQIQREFYVLFCGHQNPKIPTIIPI